MIPKYIPIVRAKKGEFDAFTHLSRRTAGRILPIFELPRLTDRVRSGARFAGSRTVIADYLDEVVQQIAGASGPREVLIDIFSWPPHSTTENGEHVLGYANRRLRELGVFANPVVGYDRWDDIEYRAALCSSIGTENVPLCIRFDSEAIEDMKDPEFFEERVNDILDRASLTPAACGALVDFGDVTGQSIDDLQGKIELAVESLGVWSFRYIALAGCSMPATINLAVPRQDSAALVIRREMIAWQATRRGHPSLPLVFSDYGVRGPGSAEDIIAPDTNGKIRYTTDRHYFVARGHSLRVGNKGAQNFELARAVVDSPHYLGESFSWGDERTMCCSRGEFKGNPTTWIAIDTNHHIEAIVAEIMEFELQLAAQRSVSVTP